jgi:2-polyprenyl-6-methoxyphenol hydroxylase-like FAD-dependent oxidoreductase
MRVLIVGAGIGGLTLASALAKSGWSIDIAERSPVLNPAGVGIVLHPNGLRVLKQLEMHEGIAAAGNVVRYMQLIRGESVVTIDLREVWEEQPTIAVLRTELHDVLWRGAFANEHSHPRLLMDCRILGVEKPDTRPVVRFENGCTETYDLVIGADGVHSAVRQSLFPGSDAISTDLLYFRFQARNVIDLSPDTWRTLERHDASYGFIPLGGDRVHCFVQLRTGENPCPAGEEEAYFRTAFGPWDRALVETLDARCGPMHVGFACMVRPVRWFRGRCVLLGDASHAVSPTLSEGASLAMEDALVLSLVLGRGRSIDAAISSYSLVRSERINWTHRMALAQVNAARRQRGQSQVNSAVATNHMRKMYEPLRRSPIPESWPLELLAR